MNEVLDQIVNFMSAYALQCVGKHCLLLIQFTVEILCWSPDLSPGLLIVRGFQNHGQTRLDSLCGLHIRYEASFWTGKQKDVDKHSYPEWNLQLFFPTAVCYQESPR
jgi:hypothetical protein